jgi:hypothetical protein
MEWGKKLLLLLIETVYWAHNIKLRKIKDVLDPDWINR